MPTRCSLQQPAETDMQRALAALMLTCLLAGCTETTFTFGGSAQVNQAIEPFPSNYLASAAVAVVGVPVEPGQKVAVSYPQPTIGTTAFDPKRWYVCVLGLEPSASAPDSPHIIVFRRFGTPLLVQAAASEACRTATGYQNLKPA
jgi:hypothetical protein